MQRADAHCGVFHSLDVGMCQEQELRVFCFSEFQEKEESQDFGSTAGLRHDGPPAGSSFGSSLLGATSHQEMRTGSGHPTSSPLSSQCMPMLTSNHHTCCIRPHTAYFERMTMESKVQMGKKQEACLSL